MQCLLCCAAIKPAMPDYGPSGWLEPTLPGAIRSRSRQHQSQGDRGTAVPRDSPVCRHERSGTENLRRERRPGIVRQKPMAVYKGRQRDGKDYHGRNEQIAGQPPCAGLWVWGEAGRRDCSYQVFKYSRRAHPAADTHRHHSVVGLTALHLLNDRRG